MIATSVIIATYNGAHKIPHLLQALMRQTISDFEIVVVIDGSSDNTMSVVQEFSREFKSLQIVEQVNSGRSKVRNRGVAAAGGELLIFYDDDMVPFGGSIARHVQLHSDGIDKLVSGNPVELIGSDKTDIQNYKASRTANWVMKYIDPLSQLRLENLFFSAANCSVRRSVFEKLNGFDENLTDAEDYDLARRSLQLGIPVFFDKNNTAVHQDMITTRSYVFRQRKYAKAHERLGMSRRLPDTEPYIRRKLKRLVYRVFANPMWIRLVDAEALKFLPRTMRYAIYDIIIHSLSIEYPGVKI